MTNPFRRAVLVACAAATVLFASTGGADTIRRVPLFRSGIESDVVSDINIANVYGNASSAPEIVTCSSGSAFALSASGGSYETVWFTQRVNCSAIAAGDLDGDGAAEVVVATTEPQGNSPKLHIYTPLGYGAPRTVVGLPSLSPVTDLHIANSDADAGVEILVTTPNDTYIFDGATLALEWTATGRGGYFVGVADLEKDGVPEIVVSGTEGSVLNGVTRTFKWGYSGGFGAEVAIGDVDGDGKAEIIGGSASTVRIVNGDTLTTATFTLPLYDSVQRLTVGDGNNDGQAEIVVGDDQWGNVGGYSVTGTALWSIVNPEHGVSGLAIGDPDGDGTNEAIWGAGYSSSGRDALFVGNTGTRAIEWSTLDLDGPMETVAADLDRDGDVEIVTLTWSTDSGYAGGQIRVFDLSGRLLASFLSGGGYSHSSSLAVGQLDADPALEIAALHGYYGGVIQVYDGATYAHEWTSPSAFSQNVLVIRNVDADPVDEIFVATLDKKLQVLNGASPIVQATTPALSGWALHDLAIADVDRDGALDAVVAADSSFYVFKASDLSQRGHVADLQNVTAVAATDGEIAINWGSWIRAYSGTTLALQWTCSLQNSITTLNYVSFHGTKYIAATDDASFYLYPAGGNACPERVYTEFPLPHIEHLTFSDINGDGTPEMLAGTVHNSEVSLLHFSGEPRGDSDDDQLVTDADMDALAQYFFGNGAVPSAGGDVNGDTSLRADDLFYLINYRRGTGAAPPQ
jgi:hypothetical protein